MVTPGSMLGPYRIERQLGQGGMAVVYLARDDRLNRQVAVKVIPSTFHADPSIVERLRLEAQAAAGLRHPNIVTVHDIIETGDIRAIVMEYVAGDTLRQHMGRRFSAGEVVRLLGPVAEALDYAHSKGLIHRDIKPSNILMTIDSRPILSDFGLVRLADQETGLTATALTVGTPEYIAPEQALGGTITKAVDIFSLAVIAYEMICGAQPYVADTPVALVVAHAYNDPRSPREVFPDIAQPLEQALLKGLTRDPLQRYRSAGDFINALKGEASASTIPFVPPIEQSVTAPLPTMSGTATMVQATPCPRCGVPTAPDERFCHACGYGLVPGTTQLGPAPVSAPPAAAAAPAYAPPPPATAVGSGNAGGFPKTIAAVVVVVLLAVGGVWGWSRIQAANSGVAQPTSTPTVAIVQTQGPENQTATATASATSPPATATAASATATVVITATTAPVRLNLPTSPARQIAIPDGIDPRERSVLETLNQNGQKYIDALRNTDERLLADVFSGSALTKYTRDVLDLRNAGRYQAAEMVTISLTEFRLEGQDRAFVRSQERWRQSTFERSSGRRINGTDTLFNESYRLVLSNGRWLIDENTSSVVSQSPY